MDDRIAIRIAIRQCNQQSPVDNSIFNLQSAIFIVFLKIRELSKNITVYGLGDVAVSVINVFLLPIYAVYFPTHDYGVIGLLGVFEVGAKIVFRFGLDGSFMRFF